MINRLTCKLHVPTISGYGTASVDDTSPFVMAFADIRVIIFISFHVGKRASFKFARSSQNMM